jgi:hypothetical protein
MRNAMMNSTIERQQHATHRLTSSLKLKDRPVFRLAWQEVKTVETVEFKAGGVMTRIHSTRIDETDALEKAVKELMERLDSKRFIRVNLGEKDEVINTNCIESIADFRLEVVDGPN